MAAMDRRECTQPDEAVGPPRCRRVPWCAFPRRGQPRRRGLAACTGSRSPAQRRRYRRLTLQWHGRPPIDRGVLLAHRHRLCMLPRDPEWPVGPRVRGGDLSVAVRAPGLRALQLPVAGEVPARRTGRPPCEPERLPPVSDGPRLVWTAPSTGVRRKTRVEWEVIHGFYEQMNVRLADEGPWTREELALAYMRGARQLVQHYSTCLALVDYIVTTVRMWQLVDGMVHANRNDAERQRQREKG
mmetsp:Transcript_56797/g.161224  ORF Transcript_56797/g.161224 Transcript_56797/m.161224 type:complete len:242 (-) Transcript_56797:309-1034(-)